MTDSDSADDVACEQEEDESRSLLASLVSACIKASDCERVLQQLDDDELEYADVFDSPEPELREMLSEAGLAAKHRGRLMRHLMQCPGSGVYNSKQAKKQPSVIILSTEQNEFIAAFYESFKTVGCNVASIQNAIIATFTSTLAILAPPQ